MKDRELDQILNQWETTVPETDPAFKRAVWTRIATENDSIPAVIRWLSRLTDRLSFPQVGIPVGVAALAITASLAALHGQQKAGQLNYELAREYRHSIDPIAMVELASFRSEQ